MTTSTPGPAVDLIEHAARIIAAKQREPHTAPFHWAGALWEAGMLVAPGTAIPPDTLAKCPRCGETRVTTRWDVCTPCAADMGWEPRCDACLTEQRGENADGMGHVPTCGGGKR